MSPSTATPTRPRRRPLRAPDFHDWDSRAADALELARELPPGPARTAALKQAGLLRNAAEARAWMCPNPPRTAK